MHSKNIQTESHHGQSLPSREKKKRIKKRNKGFSRERNKSSEELSGVAKSTTLSPHEVSLEKLPEGNSTDLACKEEFWLQIWDWCCCHVNPGSTQPHHMPKHEGKMEETDRRSCWMAGEAGLSSCQRGKMKWVLSCSRFGFSCSRGAGMWCCTRKKILPPAPRERRRSSLH